MQAMAKAHLQTGSDERNDFRHISKGQQVRDLILDISAKGSK